VEFGRYLLKVLVGRKVGKVSKKKEKKRVGGGEKIKLQKKAEIRAEKGQTKKSEAGMAKG